MRDCFCDKFVVGEPWIQGRDCRLCWLYHNSSEYKALWDNLPPSVDIPLEERQQLTFKQRLANFAKAMVAETAWRSKGGRGPTEEEKAKRRAICDTCDAHEPSDDSCKLCGCYLEAGLFPPRPLGKLDCATQACPKKIWGTVAGALVAGCRGAEKSQSG